MVKFRIFMSLGGWWVSQKGCRGVIELRKRLAIIISRYVKKFWEMNMLKSTFIGEEHKALGKTLSRLEISTISLNNLPFPV